MNDDLQWNREGKLQVLLVLNVQLQGEITRRGKTDATVQFSYNKESYKPFDGWTPNSKPSWWGDYNKVKHNRAENDNIKLANLKNVFNALAALFILNRYLCKIVCSNKIMKEPEIKSNLFTMVGWDICILEGNGFVRRLSTNGNMSVLVES